MSHEPLHAPGSFSESGSPQPLPLPSPASGPAAPQGSGPSQSAGKPVWVRPPAWVPPERIAASEVPLVRCAYSGERRPEAEMLRIDGHWIAPEHKDAAVELLHQGGQFEVRGAQVAPVPNFLLVLQRGWSLFAMNWKVLLLVHLSVGLPISIVSCYWGLQLEEDDWAGVIKLENRLQIWIGILATAGFTRVLSVSWEGGKPAFGDAMGTAFRRWPGMWLVYFLTGLLSVIGFILLIIPGFLVLVRTAFANLCLVDGGEKATNAMRTSSDLAKGHFWRIVGFGTFYTVVAILATAPFMVAQEFLPEDLQRWEIDAAVQWVGSIPTVWLYCCLFVLYKAILAQKGLDDPASWRAYTASVERGGGGLFGK